MESQRDKKKTILGFFTRKATTSSREEQSPSNNETSNYDDEHEHQHVVKFQRVDICVSDYVQLDPAMRTPIWQCPVNIKDEIRRSYILRGPFQPDMEYPRTKIGDQYRRFQKCWFEQFPWLEYSPHKDAVFCFPCFIFQEKEARYPAFTVDGFRGWKRVNDGKRCALLIHVGNPTSPHNNAVRSMSFLMNAGVHIDKVINAQTSEEVKKNRLRLTTTIESVRWLCMQGCALRGHDESPSSQNRGNLIELIKLMGKLVVDIQNVILQKAPKNATYTSPDIQKQILHILADKVRKKIRGEGGNAKFCILVDEAKDVADKQQMAIVLRFVDSEGFIKERFFDIVNVAHTNAETHKKEICDVLRRNDLYIKNIRGQGYNGASNMSGAWNGLQALFIRECPQAYYVHCFAHRLQLALVGAAEKQGSVWGSPKRDNELKSAQAIEIAERVATGVCETGSGLNQMGSLRRAGKTRWSSHFESICSMIDMYHSVIIVLGHIEDEADNNPTRGQATGHLRVMKSFDFIFMLYVMNKVMAITDLLCQALQSKSLDILQAMDLISNTKDLLCCLRDDGYDILLKSVQLACERIGVQVPDMNACYALGRACRRKDSITFEHHYHFDIFNAVIDLQLEEISSRFDEESMELLRLAYALEPRENFKMFDDGDIYRLAEEFYPNDFSGQELHYLRSQLEHYKFDIIHSGRFNNLSNISELCRRLVETGKAQYYHLIDRLIRLVLTLPVSTATTERSFSAMKLVKTDLRNKMEDEYLADCLMVYIEREFAAGIDTNLIIDEFYSKKHRRVQLK